MEDTASTCRIYCNSCKKLTHHTLAFSHSYDHRSGEESLNMYGQFRLWFCAGCDNCTMEDYYTTDYMFSQDGDGEFSQEYASTYHPKPAVGFRADKQFHKLPPKLKTLYDEVIRAHNDKLDLLCSVGLRGLLEGICADKNISGSDLETKIDRMTTVLPADIVKNLHSFRFIGNDAVHRLEAPNEFELGLALDVIEDILNFLYALDYKVSLLEKLKGKQARVKAKVGTPTG
jgi:hypothetical protein